MQNKRGPTGRRKTNSSQLLNEIAAGVTAEIGDAFFQSLVTFLARTVEADISFVGEVSPENHEIVKTVAFFDSGATRENFTYRLRRTPCENVVGKRLSFYPRQVQQEFPEDTILKEMNIESYIGTPLFDSNKAPLGIIVVMDRYPMTDEAHVTSLLEIFATRAASELERARFENVLNRHQHELEHMVKERSRELTRTNRSLKKEIRERKKAEKKLLDYQKQLQSLASQISLIEEREKRRIASDLHDCVGQTLALAKIKLGLLGKSISDDELQENINEIRRLLEQSIRETRSLTFELSPPILYELGFEQAVTWLSDQFREKYGLKTTLIDDDSAKPFDSNIRFFLFQSIRELLINIVKHAQTDEAKIMLRKQNEKLHISVVDNGAGMPESKKRKTGYGLFNMREKMNQINGKIYIHSRQGEGTEIQLIVPFQQNGKSSQRRTP